MTGPSTQQHYKEQPDLQKQEKHPEEWQEKEEPDRPKLLVARGRSSSEPSSVLCRSVKLPLTSSSPTPPAVKGNLNLIQLKTKRIFKKLMRKRMKGLRFRAFWNPPKVRVGCSLLSSVPIGSWMVNPDSGGRSGDIHHVFLIDVAWWRHLGSRLPNSLSGAIRLPINLFHTHTS